MSKPYPLSIDVPRELIDRLRELKPELKVSMTEMVVEGIVMFLQLYSASPPDFPTLDERRAANRERLRRTALARWHPKEEK
jgi:hypothetical protein